MKNFNFNFPEILNYKNSINNIYQEIGTVSDSVQKSKKIVLCFINRSGSNYLAELMKNTNLMGNAQEYLNENTVENLKNKHSLKNFSDYFNFLYNNFHSNNNVFSFQVGLHQLHYLLECNQELKLFDQNTSFIYINRLDSIMQSISFYKAIKTNSYTSEQPEICSNVELNLIKIEEIFDSLISRKIMFELLFNIYNLNIYKINYEYLINNPEKFIKEILDYTKIDYSHIKNFDIETKIKKQATTQNDEWAQIIRNDLKNKFN